MHSSRMRTARSSSHRGAASVHARIHPPGVGLEIPLGVGLETPPGVGLETPQVWVWRPPQARPLNFPLGCGPGDLPAQTPELPPGCEPGNLQGMLGYHPSGDLLQGMLE